MRNNRYNSRKRRLDLQGIMLIGACLGTLCGMLYAAYCADRAHGISISRSLHNNGL